MNTIKTLTVNGKQYELTDSVAREQLAHQSQRTDDLAEACPIVCSAYGSSISVGDAANFPVRALRLYGKTVQAGTPTPDVPVDLDSAGHSGTITVHIAGKNLFSGFVKGVNLNHNTGLEITTASAAVTDYIPVTFDDSTNMYLSGLSADLMSCVYAYDADKTPVARSAANNVQCRALNKKSFINAFNSTKPIAFIRINIYENNNVTGTIDLVDSLTPQLELGTTETEYAPYTGQIFTVPTPNGLPGIPVSTDGNYTDENGQQWICDEIDLARGVYVQRIAGVTFDGSTDEKWNYNNMVDTSGFVINQHIISCNVLGMSPVISTHYPGAKFADRKKKYGIVYTYNSGIGISVSPDVASSTGEWKAVLAENPVTVQYILAEPIKTVLDAETLAAYASLRTYKPVTTMLNNAGAGMWVEYVADTKTYIDKTIAKAIGNG